MHVIKRSGDAMESGFAARSPDPERLPGPDLPFPGTIGPEHAVAHRGWREACDRALSAVLSGPGLVLVLGQPGTGKTLLLQHLARVLRASGTDVLLWTRCDLEVTEDEKVASGIAQRRVVLIDEADRMSAGSLQHLRHLGRCAFVLAGVIDPGGNRKTAAADGTTIVRLTALAPDEVGAFVTARLVQAGLRPDLLTEEAVERLAALTGGLPRVMNMLTGSALFLARTAQASRVEAAHVNEAAALREGQPDLGCQPAAGPSLPADPPPADAHPVHAPPVAASGTPLRTRAGTLTAAHPPRGEQTRRRRSRAAAAGLCATAGLAATCAWFLIRPGQHAPQAKLRPETALAPTSPTSPRVAAIQPMHSSGPVGTTTGSPSFRGAPLQQASPPHDQATSRSVRLSPRHARGHAIARTGPEPGGGEPHAEVPGGRSGILDRHGERSPVASTQRADGSPPWIATVPPLEALGERRAPKYVGIYTTGPDGIRTFRASP